MVLWCSVDCWSYGVVPNAFQSAGGLNQAGKERTAESLHSDDRVCTYVLIEFVWCLC